MNFNKLPIAELLYGSIALIGTCLIAWMLYERLDHPFSAGIPVVCAIALASRWSILGWIVPAMVLVGIGLVTRANLNFVGLDAGVMAITCLITFASLLRYLARFRITGNPFLTTRFNYSPGQETTPLQHISVGHLFSLVLILCAWLVAAAMCREITHVTSDVKLYAIYSQRADSELGLIPEGYWGIQLFVTLLLIFWVARQILGYLHLRRNARAVAGMALRSELWKWNGREQRMISKQMRKNNIGETGS